MTLPLKPFEAYVDMAVEVERHLLSLRDSHAVHEVSYEAHVNGGDPRWVHPVFEFLGVDPGYVPNLQGRHNKGGLPRNRWLHKQMLQRSGWRGTVLKYTPKPLRRLGRWAYYNNLKHPGPMPDDARRRLIDLYRPDIEKLQGLIGKDLSGWLA